MRKKPPREWTLSSVENLAGPTRQVVNYDEEEIDEQHGGLGQEEAPGRSGYQKLPEGKSVELGQKK